MCRMRRRARDSQRLTARARVQVPLPQLAEEALEERVADVAARAALSADALPSVAFFTFVNTHQSLNAVAFSADGRLVIGAERSMRCCGCVLWVWQCLMHS